MDHNDPSQAWAVKAWRILEIPAQFSKLETRRGNLSLLLYSIVSRVYFVVIDARYTIDFTEYSVFKIRLLCRGQMEARWERLEEDPAASIPRSDI